MGAIDNATLLAVKVQEFAKGYFGPDDPYLRISIVPEDKFAKISFTRLDQIPMAVVMEIFNKATDLGASSGGVRYTGEVYVNFKDKS